MRIETPKGGALVIDFVYVALEQDALADDLLAGQPEAMLDMDARVEKLLHHMERCQTEHKRSHAR